MSMEGRAFFGIALEDTKKGEPGEFKLLGIMADEDSLPPYDPKGLVLAWGFVVIICAVFFWIGFVVALWVTP